VGHPRQPRVQLPLGPDLDARTVGAGRGRGQAASPENPLFWFGALGVVTFGLMAFSTTVRVGKTSASLTIGDT
jgi:hypothetical protein